MYFIGIDPGSSGAVSILKSDGSIEYVFDMPMRFLIKRKKRERKSKYLADGKTLRKKVSPIKQDNRKVLDAKLLFRNLLPYKDNVSVCVLEFVSSHSRQGVKSMFSFGEIVGAIKGVLESLGINYRMVTPITWQKSFDLTGKNKTKDEHKQDIMILSQSFYPNIEYHGSKGGLKDGRSDSLLIARYGFNNKGQGNWIGMGPFDEQDPELC